MSTTGDRLPSQFLRIIALAAFYVTDDNYLMYSSTALKPQKAKEHVHGIMFQILDAHMHNMQSIAP